MGLIFGDPALFITKWMDSNMKPIRNRADFVRQRNRWSKWATTYQLSQSKWHQKGAIRFDSKQHQETNGAMIIARLMIMPLQIKSLSPKPQIPAPVMKPMAKVNPLHEIGILKRELLSYGEYKTEVESELATTNRTPARTLVTRHFLIPPA